MIFTATDEALGPIGEATGDRKIISVSEKKTPKW
jgi:hypothetical protein